MRIAFYTIGVTVFLIASCGKKEEGQYKSNNKDNTAKTVELRKEEDAYKLYRNGLPYYIQGAGGSSHLELMKSMGANSIKTWNTNNAKKLLDKANSLGLTVTLCLDIGRPRLGFDYNDEKAKKEQLKWVRKEVLKYKDHPALLMWAVGNEVNEEWGKDKDLLKSPEVINMWKGVDEVARLVKQIDPNHPTTTFIVPKTTTILSIKYFCPNIDILSINTFGALYKLSKKLNKNFLGWDKPYVVSEWGSRGYWESDSTLWSVPIEQTTFEKAEFCKKNYSYIKEAKEKCLGSYVFYWGHKQERTATWFSMLSEKGEKNEVVDMMSYLWKKEWPSNRAPSISEITIDGKHAKKNVIFTNDSLVRHVARVKTSDKENDSLSYYWHIFHESTELKTGGDQEKSPDMVKDIYMEGRGNKFYFQAPKQAGGYRVYCYIYDGHNNIATANIPFYVLFP